MNQTKAQLKTKSTKQKIYYLLATLTMYIMAGVYYVWQAGKLDDLPKIALVMSFALIPVVIVLIATYFASKDPSASPKAFKKE